jgi:hypothetical protein
MAYSLEDAARQIHLSPPTNPVFRQAVFPSPDNHNSVGDGVNVRYTTF